MEQFNIVITSKAQSDLSECVNFVLKVSKEAAINLTNEIYDCLESLNTFPERNPIFEMPKSFPFIIRKQVINKRYVALYSIEDNNIVIYRILDTRRKFDYLIS